MPEGKINKLAPWIFTLSLLFFVANIFFRIYVSQYGDPYDLMWISTVEIFFRVVFDLMLFAVIVAIPIFILSYVWKDKRSFFVNLATAIVAGISTIFLVIFFVKSGDYFHWLIWFGEDFEPVARVLGLILGAAVVAFLHMSIRSKNKKFLLTIGVLLLILTTIMIYREARQSGEFVTTTVCSHNFFSGFPYNTAYPQYTADEVRELLPLCKKSILFPYSEIKIGDETIVY